MPKGPNLVEGEMTDDVDTRRRRALYRANHRGTKEMDHLVGRYAEARVQAMSACALDRFEGFLALPDPLLQHWFFDTSGTPDSEFVDIIADLRAFHGLAPSSTSNG